MYSIETTGGMMKAAQISGYGGQEVVSTKDGVAKPAFGDDQVLVEVYAAGVNPFDVAVREGYARQMAELEFPAVLGGDLSGIVSEIGADVTSLKVGDKVYGQAGANSGHGSFAEFAPVKASQLAAVPASVDFTTAAALPLAAVSAYQALVDNIDLQAGQKILIHGGSGGIGSLAIQLAKHLGAHIATTVSGSDVDFVKSLGADEVIDYKTQDFSTIIKDYDAVFDTIGGETNTKSYLVLKPEGALVSMVAQPDETLVEEHDVVYTSQNTRVTTERLQEVAELVDDGTLKVNIDKVFPLEEAAEALAYLKIGHPKGKLVIEIKTI